MRSRNLETALRVATKYRVYLPPETLSHFPYRGQDEPFLEDVRKARLAWSDAPPDVDAGLPHLSVVREYHGERADSSGRLEQRIPSHSWHHLLAGLVSEFETRPAGTPGSTRAPQGCCEAQVGDI